MQQPRQRPTYAELYSQQRSASSSPVPPGGARSTATSTNGRSAAQPAASEPGKLQPLETAGGRPPSSPRASPKASPRAPAAVMAAQQKPSRIPLHPARAHSPRPGASAGPSPRGGRPTAGHKAGQQSSAAGTSPAAAAGTSPAIASHINGAVAAAAAANGSPSMAVSGPPAANQVGACSVRQLTAPPSHVPAGCMYTCTHASTIPCGS